MDAAPRQAAEFPKWEAYLLTALLLYSQIVGFVVNGCLWEDVIGGTDQLYGSGSRTRRLLGRFINEASVNTRQGRVVGNYIQPQGNLPVVMP
jgi:hypothetical protein